jgi:hypothetical protein
MIRNVHERTFEASASKLALLLDGLASANDLLWPHKQWPAMRFDRPLQVGAVGGHGPVRYTIESYQPGRSIRFRFTSPLGFLGTHGFEIEELTPNQSRLRHTLEMNVQGSAPLSWPLIFRPLHDALLEDSLDCAARYLKAAPKNRGWSRWVRFLRWLLAPRRS